MNQRSRLVEVEPPKEACLLAGVLTPGLLAAGEEPLEEIARLVETAGGEVVGRVTQRADRPHPASYFGKGKLAELAAAVVDAGADTVVVDDTLSAKQLSAVENAVSRKVIDRNEVIIDIFQHRARSHQAKLQVHLAQLKYELPRLARKWTHLERLGGGIGTRGPGESQIETDRRLLRGDIARLRRELDAIEKRKEREVRSRDAGAYSVCLVGYTNAGKSSLLHRLTGADAFVEDRLFATLDTLTRRLENEASGPILLSDTVGFIRRLPHHLVASFHATLEEAAQADLLLHVVDIASPLAATYRQAADDTLAELGLADKPLIYVLNQVDRVADRSLLDALAHTLPDAFATSAKTGEGTEALLDEIRQRAQAARKVVRLRFSAGDGRRFALVNERASVLKTGYDGDEVIIDALIDPALVARLEKLPGPMRVEPATP